MQLHLPLRATVLLVLGLSLLLLPLAVAPIPPMGDFPNHLSRMWLLSGGASLPGISDMYAVRWDTLTNVAIDVVGATLGRLTSYEFAGRLCVAAAIVLPPLGGALLWRAVHGRWHWWVAAFGLLVWGQALLSGFLNFVIGVGVALLAAAAEPWAARQVAVAQLVLRPLFVAVLLLCHPFALLFYLFLWAGLAWGPAVRPDWRDLLGRLALLGVSLAGAGALAYAYTDSPPGTEEHLGLGTVVQAFREGVWHFEREPGQKLLFALLSVRSYSVAVDLVCGAALLLPIALAAFAGRLRVHAGLLIAGLLLALCYLAFPPFLLGAWWVDARFATMAPLALAAAVLPDLPLRSRRLCAALIVASVMAQTTLVAAAWNARQADVGAVSRAFSVIPPGAKVLPLEQIPSDWKAAPLGRYTDYGQPSYRHLPALGVPLRHVFLPMIFAARGKQPVQVLPPWDAMSEPNGGQIADVHVLDDPSHVHGLERARYAVNWRRFDYALVVNADLPDAAGPLAPVPGLTLLADEGFARVYRIESPR